MKKNKTIINIIFIIIIIIIIIVIIPIIILYKVIQGVDARELCKYDNNYVMSGLLLLSIPSLPILISHLFPSPPVVPAALYTLDRNVCCYVYVYCLSQVAIDGWKKKKVFVCTVKTKMLFSYGNVKNMLRVAACMMKGKKHRYKWYREC